jgi:hypothetical protein
MAAAIPDAHFHSFAPGPHNGFDIIDDLAEYVLRFVVEMPNTPTEERVLRTVLFTDIVGSTERLTAGGDQHWRHQLDNHDSLVEHILSRYGGIRANHTGDGIFALFDATNKGGGLRARPCACTCRARNSDPGRHSHWGMRTTWRPMERAGGAHRSTNWCDGRTGRGVDQSDRTRSVSGIRPALQQPRCSPTERAPRRHRGLPGHSPTRALASQPTYIGCAGSLDRPSGRAQAIALV